MGTSSAKNQSHYPKDRTRSRVRLSRAPRTNPGRNVEIVASDQTSLAGSIFEPDTANPEARKNPRGTILMAGGTGIPRRFYRSFATFLARHGYATLTLDFRGVGDSAPDDLNGYQATKQDWARLDSSAALAWLRNEYPNVPRILIGHSVGAQLPGLFDAPEELDAVVSVGTGYGFWGNMPRPYRYFVWSVWYVLVPAFTRLLGYLPAKKLGLGEDLPAGVAREWARWGKRANYFEDELASESGFKDLDAPWLAILADDDKIAVPENALPLYELYPNSPLEVVSLKPSDHDLDEIGHLGFFSRRKRVLWPIVTRWLEQTLSADQSESDLH